jgi:serine/threonine-protein kinase
LRQDAPSADPNERPTRPYSQGVLVGTPAYMAPEQAWGRREDIDERTDVYGLGGLIYAMLTLRPPHDGGDTDADLELAKRGIVRDPSQVVRGRELPPGLCRIAMRALAADPAHRYPSIGQMRSDLERFLRGGGWLEQVRLPRGTVVLREGDAPDAAYILLDGQCELYRMIQGQPRFVRVLGPREVFGETSIFGSSTRTATIVAASDVSLVRVTREALERELERSEWLQAFVRALAERFIELDQRVRQLEKDPGPALKPRT